MVDQFVPFGLTSVKGLFQGVQHEVGSHRAADPPADDPPSKHVDYEGDVDETLPGRNVGEVTDPQLIWSLGLELSINAVERARRLRIGYCCAHDFASHDATQASLAHEALHGAAGHIRPLTPQLAPNLVSPVDLQVRLPDTFDVNAQHVISLDTGTA